MDSNNSVNERKMELFFIHVWTNTVQQKIHKIDSASKDNLTSQSIFIYQKSLVSFPQQVADAVHAIFKVQTIQKQHSHSWEKRVGKLRSVMLKECRKEQATANFLFSINFIVNFNTYRKLYEHMYTQATTSKTNRQFI